MAQSRWLILSASLILASALGAQPAPTAFSPLDGSWVGDGTLFDRPARFTMQWREEDGFASLHFTNTFVGPDGSLTPVLRAAAVYRTDPEQPEGVWLDSRGVRIELAWEVSQSSLVVTWTAPTETGRTSYRVRPAGEMSVVDEVRRDGTWSVFATAVLRRIPP